MSKKRATAIFDLSLRVGPLTCPSELVLSAAQKWRPENPPCCGNDSSLGSPVFRTTFVLPLWPIL